MSHTVTTRRSSTRGQKVRKAAAPTHCMCQRDWHFGSKEERNGAHLYHQRFARKNLTEVNPGWWYCRDCARHCTHAAMLAHFAARGVEVRTVKVPVKNLLLSPPTKRGGR